MTILQWSFLPRCCSANLDSAKVKMEIVKERNTIAGCSDPRQKPKYQTEAVTAPCNDSTIDLYGEQCQGSWSCMWKPMFSQSMLHDRLGNGLVLPTLTSLKKESQLSHFSAFKTKRICKWTQRMHKVLPLPYTEDTGLRNRRSKRVLNASIKMRSLKNIWKRSFNLQKPPP